MSLTETTFMGENPHEMRGTVRGLGGAVAEQLRETFPNNATKLVAQALRCTPKTAENILAGHLSARTATMIIETFGPGFMADAVMAAAGTTLVNFIRTQAADARATALRHEEHARELSKLETTLRASRGPQRESGVGRAP